VTSRDDDSAQIARQRVEAELVKTTAALDLRTDELARSLAMIRAVLESTTNAILVTDVGGSVTDYNEKFIELWRVPRDVIATREYRTVLDHICAQFADPGACRDRVDAIYRASPAESFDTLELADGRVFERFSKIQCIEEANVGRVWSFRDITTSRRTEQALRDESRVLELLNETGTVIASQLELQTLVQAVTDAATKLSGAKFGAFFYTTKDAAGEAFQLYTLSGAPREAFEHLGHPRPTALFGTTFRGEGTVRCDDVAQDARYGTMAPYFGMPADHIPVRSYLAVPVKSRSGNVLGGLLFGHPEPGVFTARSERVITGVAAQAAIAIDNAQLFEDLRRAANEREALLEAERKARAEVERVSLMKDEFLATLSHELRTPLNAVLGWSEILLAGVPDPANVQRGLETIARNARAQAQLIEDLLDMSRIVSGKVRLDVQRTSLASVVDAAIDAVKPSVDAKAIRLYKILDPDAGPVFGDPHRLQQITWNLLSNAVKFTPKGGWIQVLVTRIAAHVEITVSDSGPGISPDFLPQVFERFRQADASITRKHGGLGLGLAIVKQLVELHGGTVRAENGSAGRGATFLVTLPLGASRDEEHDEREHPATERTPVPREGVYLAGTKVLVIDDEPDARDLIKWVLESSQAEVIVGASAADGLELVEHQRPDVVISDIGMPERDGYQFIRDVRSLPAASGGKTPAIALTAFARSEDRTRALLAGYQIHLAKPIEPQELVATVGSLVGRTAKSER
jgi:signal transduction histidine kinase/ActR/RegA family two-component response regulator